MLPEASSEPCADQLHAVSFPCLLSLNAVASVGGAILAFNMGNTNTGDCTPGTCPLDNGYLLYQPSLGGSAFMLAAFAVLIPINVFTGIRHKTPLFASTIVTGLLLQVMAYIGQLLLRTDQARRSYFLVSLLGAMTGPTLISASIYLVLPHILIVYGREVSILSRPIYLSVVFLAFDVFTLAFQAVGCAFAVCGGTQDEVGPPHPLPTSFFSSLLVFLC